MEYNSKLIPLFPFFLQSLKQVKGKFYNFKINFLENRLLSLYSANILDGMQPNLAFGAKRQLLHTDCICSFSNALNHLCFPFFIDLISFENLQYTCSPAKVKPLKLINTPKFSVSTWICLCFIHSQYSIFSHVLECWLAWKILCLIYSLFRVMFYKPKK